MQKSLLSFTLMAAWVVAGAVIFAALALTQVPAAPTKARTSKEMSISSHGDGHLYIQTNEDKNAIIHYHRSANGALTEVERVATGGAGSGLLSPIYHTNRPNHFEGADSVILTPDHRFLFTTNGGDNSVSSFAVDKEGRLKLVDTKPTGNPTKGGAKSLAYAPSSRTLFVLHTVGPDHLRLMSVDEKGNLTARPEQYSVNTSDWPNRGPTMAAVSPDEKFVIVGTTFDELPTRKNPDGSVILWIPRPDGASVRYQTAPDALLKSLHVIASNAPDPDGLVVFPVREDGSLREAQYQDAKGASPFYIAFLNGRPDTFIIGYAVSDGCAMATIDANGKIDVGPLMKIDTSRGQPSELCWLAISPDNRFVYTTNFGYSDLSTFRIDGKKLSIAN